MTMADAFHRFFATSAKAIEGLLADELRTLGAKNVREKRAGVEFEGPMSIGYRACLWSRLASRVLFPIAKFEAGTPEALYDGIGSVAWLDHLRPEGTIAIDVTATGSTIANTHYAALKAKDAIVDQVRAQRGTRPSVDLRRPDLRINIHLRKQDAIVNVDLAGEALHRRGYRLSTGEAPLRENVAAAMLIRADWPALSKTGLPLLDPMCGSGTLPIEAALIATDTAPGLERDYYGFLGWCGHDEKVWQVLLEEARARAAEGAGNRSSIVGFDHDPHAVRTALANVERAGFRDRIHIERRELQHCEPPPAARGKAGVVVVNPPYGQRLGELRQLEPLYAALGARLKEKFAGWTAYLLTGEEALGKKLGLRADRRNRLYNGNIPCLLLRLPLHANATGAGAPSSDASRDPTPVSAPNAGREMLRNRLRKNLKRLGKRAARELVTCYRLYDADMPEYSFAIDLYEKWVSVQEYQPPSTIEPATAAARVEDLLAVLPELLGIEPRNLVMKERRRQRGSDQYEKLDRRGVFREVGEADYRFLINLTDYIDTGLFLDHRKTRALIRKQADGKRFLNLFGYTGSATVAAAKGGATESVTVDMSKTYTEWARRNFDLNGLRRSDHEIIAADCLEWIRESRRRFGLIFLDPPTFSTSKRMEGSFDLQRDHVELILATAKLLDPGGLLIFSNNFRRFKLNNEALEGLNVEEISKATIPFDFERNPRIHRCWKISS